MKLYNESILDAFDKITVAITPVLTVAEKERVLQILGDLWDSAYYDS